jgi:ComF family protein
MDLARVAQDVLDLVFPRACPGCAVMLPPGPVVCGACATSLERLNPAECCPRCQDLMGPATCGRCTARPPPFQRVFAAFVYGGAVRDAVHRLKFGDAPWVARALAQLAWPGGESLPFSDVELLVPMPLHIKRHRERGYNQARLVADGLAALHGIPVANALARIKETPAVAGLHADARAAAVEGAFDVVDAALVAGKRVALVDDLVTTSATCRAASAVLLAAGATAVDVVALARGGHGAED